MCTDKIRVEGPELNLQWRRQKGFSGRTSLRYRKRDNCQSKEIGMTVAGVLKSVLMDDQRETEGWERRA